jgi:CRP-like cAMP-binding protein
VTRILPDLVDRLAEQQPLAAIPRAELEWLAAHGTVRQLAEGDVLSARGARVDGMHLLLDGHLAIFVDGSAGRHKLQDWGPGDVTGLLPFSRLVSSSVDSIAMAPTTILEIHRNDLPAMIHHCHELTSMLVHQMLDRSRQFTSSGLHDEKMVSLGKLAAGLAHELNNPVSAIARNAALLEDRLEDVERAAEMLGASKLTDRQIAGIVAVRSACRTKRADGPVSPIEQAEREEALAEWLANHGVGADIAGYLAESAVTVDLL